MSIALRSDVCVGLSTDRDHGELSKSASQINLCRRVIHLSAPGMLPLCGGGFLNLPWTPEERRRQHRPSPIFADSFQQFPSNYCLKEWSNKVSGFLQTFKARWHAICLPNALPWDLTMRPKWCIVLRWTAHSGESMLHYAKSKALLFTWTHLGVSAAGTFRDWLQGCQGPTVWDFKARKWLK